MTDVAVIILTYNEEANIAQAIRSVEGWAREIIVVDSHSTDRTLDLARNLGVRTYQHGFENYAKQRNWALSAIDMQSEWVLFLDADEWVTQGLKEEISRTILSNPAENGFFIKWRLIWMGTWVRRGYYPTWILRLFRLGKAHCDSRTCNEHLVCDGKVGYLKADLMHEDRKGLTAWIAKHNGYASLEALELLRAEQYQHEVPVRVWNGTQVERKRWLRYKVWNRMPPVLRVLLYFFYRVFIHGGVLDGRQALVYHFLQALWYPMLIDLKYLELRGMSRHEN